MAGNSPTWKKPSDVMLLHRRKRKSIVTTNGDVATTGAESIVSRTIRRAKRRNPFGCASRKRPRTTEEVTAQDKDTNGLLIKLDAITQSDSTEDRSCESLQVCPVNDADHLSDDIHQNEQSPVLSTAAKSVVGEHGAPPVDWSLKRKLRFVSDRSFNWCSPIKTSEEAIGLSHFVRCHDDDPSPQSSCLAVSQADFHKCCMLWVHPHLPWIQLFPRIITDNKLGTPCAALQNDQIQKSLMTSWAESFMSVFHLVRTQRCPYFYLCTHQFTVLFRAAGACAHAQMHAIITPTTRGFRTSLSNEGIEFTMPLCNKDKMANTSSQSEQEAGQTSDENVCNGTSEGRDAEEEDEEDIANTDDGAQTWLEDLGLDKSQYRCLQPSKVQFQQDDFRTIDGRPESTVIVQGPQTLALFNLLLNCRSCVSATGSQAGLPPTILAPVAFSGASLSTLKVKQCAIKQPGPNGSVRAAHVLEITGPILPHTVDALHTLLPVSQGSYSCTASVHEPTVPFNSMPAAPETPSSDALRQCGVPKQHVDNVVQAGELGRRAIREVTCTERALHWTV